MKGLAGVREFTEAVASPASTPGGGSVAAICGALAAALTRMVAGLAIGKKGYEDVQDELRKMIDNARSLQSRLLALTNEDSDAYDAVVKAFSMQKTTEEDKQRRSEAIQIALKGATDVPLEIMERCLEVLALSDVVLRKGNKNAFTDAGCAALLAHAALQSAALNVKVNIATISDTTFKQRAELRMESYYNKAKRLSEAISSLVDSRM